MRGAPIVITATVVGLIGVLEFHSRPSAIAVATIPAAGAAAASPAGSASSSGQLQGTGSLVEEQGQGQGELARHAEHYQDGHRAAGELQLGHAVGFRHGIRDQGHQGRDRFPGRLLAHLLAVDPPELHPALEQQAVAAQSPNIQGVSGASDTSAGFKQSLQAALQQLGAG